MDPGSLEGEGGNLNPGTLDRPLGGRRGAAHLLGGARLLGLVPQRLALVLELLVLLLRLPDARLRLTRLRCAAHTRIVTPGVQRIFFGESTS